MTTDTGREIENERERGRTGRDPIGRELNGIERERIEKDLTERENGKENEKEKEKVEEIPRGKENVRERGKRPHIETVKEANEVRDGIRNFDQFPLRNEVHSVFKDD